MKVNIHGVGHHKNKKPLKKEYTMKIATFRRGGYGDGLIESAIIGGLRKHFPDCHITAYADTSFLEILHRNTNCNAVVPVEWKRGLITEIDVRNNYYDLHDLWFDVKPLPFLEGRRSNEFISAAIKNKLSDVESRYYFFNGPELISLYEEMGVRGQTEMFSKIFNIPTTMSDAFLPDETPNMDVPQQYATISAGWTDTSFYKAWPVEKWQETCQILNKNGICPIQIGKSSETSIKGSLSATHLPLYQQYSLIKDANLCLSSDGFFAHVAAKYNRPSIVLWGMTPWQVWGHPGQHDVVSPKFECFWWTHFNWAHDSRCPEIMDAITVDMVEEKIHVVLE